MNLLIFVICPLTFRRTTDIKFHDSDEKARLDRKIWGYYALIFYLKPQDRIKRSGERVKETEYTALRNSNILMAVKKMKAKREEEKQ